MFRTVSIILISIFSFIVAQANPKENNSHGRDFSLSRMIVVVAAKSEKSAATEVVKLLKEVGVSSKISSSAGFSKAKIVLARVKTIEGAKGKDALQIKVSTNIVNVKYTSDESFRKVLEYLRKIIKNNQIQGYDITDWGGDAGGMAGKYFDASTRLLTMTQIENFAKTERTREAYVRFVDSDNWRLESTVFTLVNHKDKIYPQGGYYTFQQVAELNDRLSKSRITLIPVIDLLSPNAPFQRITGHSQYSVEGMRFVRAVIEEYAKKLGCKKICLGTVSDKADMRYLEFVNDVARHCGVEIIIKDK